MGVGEAVAKGATLGPVGSAAAGDPAAAGERDAGERELGLDDALFKVSPPTILEADAAESDASEVFPCPRAGCFCFCFLSCAMRNLRTCSGRRLRRSVLPVFELGGIKLHPNLLSRQRRQGAVGCGSHST